MTSFDYTGIKTWLCAPFAIAFVLGFTAPAFATTVPNEFQAGEAASAEEVNANFEALAQAIGNLQNELDAVTSENETLTEKVEALEQEVDRLESSVSTVGNEVTVLSANTTDQENRLAEIESSDLFAIENFLVDLESFLDIHFVSPSDTAVEGPIIRLTGANLQIVNQSQEQRTPDGTGNLVVGFSEAREFNNAQPFCSHGDYDNQGDCENEGYTWAITHNSGSHNIIGGNKAAYSRTGGLVVGLNNSVHRAYASVTGGQENRAGGYTATVATGRRNKATGGGASVLSGYFNEATGLYATVNGGRENVANGPHSTVTSGMRNQANESYSSVTGGHENQADGSRSTITGGRDNRTTASYSVISGGEGCGMYIQGTWGAIDDDGVALGDC
ncbi:hypothetical protein J2T60_001376 [Natronospira proteinivora]|uniref:Uncharacterized protein n=1 Tax=Natronospira proteinivora TaxID=1807133 RepID=A0ABT1G856_9GAMM|nr:hypothetical protein [Natronospira proteinivora]MCP1727411.1 hypothetical protein [Natronospira proteinivora]